MFELIRWLRQPEAAPAAVDGTAAARRCVEAEKILDQHRAILRAVRRHQRAAAERAMQAHIEYLSGVLREIG